MASRMNETREYSASTINSVCASLASVGDRIALLTDIFTMDGMARREEDFQLSARGADAIAEMLVEMDTWLTQAVEALSQESVALGAE